MKLQTRDLEGAALDWAVAKCEYDELAAKSIEYPQYAEFYQKISPSTNWAQGGPIIEREKINVYEIAGVWKADIPGIQLSMAGSTPLIAAMRCYVASKLGDTVDVPDVLCGGQA